MPAMASVSKFVRGRAGDRDRLVCLGFPPEKDRTRSCGCLCCVSADRFGRSVVSNLPLASVSFLRRSGARPRTEVMVTFIEEYCDPSTHYEHRSQRHEPELPSARTERDEELEVERSQPQSRAGAIRSAS